MSMNMAVRYISEKATKLIQGGVISNSRIISAEGTCGCRWEHNPSVNLPNQITVIKHCGKSECYWHLGMNYVFVTSYGSNESITSFATGKNTGSSKWENHKIVEVDNGLQTLQIDV